MPVSRSQRFQFSSQCIAIKSHEKTITRNIVHYVSLYVQKLGQTVMWEKQGAAIKSPVCVCLHI